MCYNIIVQRTEGSKEFMKCHITTTRFEKLLGRALFYGVRLRFSGRECHIVTVVSKSGRQVTMPSVHNFTSWNDYLNIITKTMQFLSEDVKEDNENAKR